MQTKSNENVEVNEKKEKKKDVDSKKKTVNKLQGKDLFKKFSITVSKEEIEKNFNEIAEKYSSDMKLPGFRKGKIPVDLIKTRYKKALNDEVLNKVVEEYVFEKIKKDKINIVSSPVVEKIDYKEEQDLHADIVVELFPEVELPQFENIEIEVPAKELKMEEFDEKKQIDVLLEANKQQTPIGDKEIEDNDLVFIVFQSKDLDTKRMSPKKEISVALKKEEPTEILDLYQEIIGKKTGDKINIKKKYPKEHGKKIWAGKNVEHFIEIKSAFEFVKPTFDKDFLKSIGFEDEESFKKKLKEEYALHSEKLRGDKIVKFIADELVKRIDFPVPKTLVEKEMLRINPQQMAFNKNESDKQKKEVLESIKKKTEESIKFSLILETMKNQLKFEVSNDELEKEFKQIAEINRISLPEVRKYYLNPDNKQGLVDSLTRVKIIDFLKNKIKIKEV